MESVKALHPQTWGWRVYGFTALALAAINLFGPNGGLRWLLLEQEIARTRQAQEAVKTELSRVRRELELFESSEAVRERKVREVLGYLKPQEVSVELVEGARGPVSGR